MPKLESKILYTSFSQMKKLKLKLKIPSQYFRGRLSESVGVIRDTKEHEFPLFKGRLSEGNREVSSHA